MCKISSLFEIANMGIWACKICLKMTFVGPGPNFWPPYLIIDQIQVKLVSIQTYLGKVLLQSIVSPLDFLLSSYNPLKMWKKSIEVVNLKILAPHHRCNFQNFS